MKKLFTLFVAALFCATMFADTKTIYCKMTQSWWTEASAAIAVHYWGRPSGNTTWPGVRMTAVDGEDGVWKYDIPTDVTGFCFVRVNPSDGSDWNSKTIDLSIQSDGRDLFVISETEKKTGDNKCNGAWGVYGAKFYITGTSNLLTDAGSSATEWASNAIVSMNDSYILTDLKKDKTYKLLVTVDGTWNTKRQFDNLTDTAGGLFLDSEQHICFRLAADGSVTVNYTNSVFTLSGNFAAPTVGIVGNFEGNTTWALQPGYTMTPADDKKSASVTFNVNAETYEMKVWEDGSFLSVNGDGETLFQINSNDCCNHVDNVNLYNTGRNFEFVADKTGNYTFTWTFATRNLVVTYPTTPTAIDNTEAEGKAVKRIVNGQLVIEKNGVRYNALGIEVK